FSFSFSHHPTPATFTLSLHDALPILDDLLVVVAAPRARERDVAVPRVAEATLEDATKLPAEAVVQHVAVAVDRDPHGALRARARSEEHTSELQSQSNLVCRLLLEKKK